MMTNQQLRSLVDAGIIDSEKSQQISTFLKLKTPPASPPDLSQPATARFDLTHVLWYAGALIIIGAMGMFTNDAFNRMGGWALTICGTVYLIGLWGLGHYLWSKRQLQIPGGLLIAGAVSMVPMIIFGIQDALDLWHFANNKPAEYKDFFPYINGSWIYMELATILVSLAAARRYAFPFILLIGAIALWFMSMDIAMWFTPTGTAYWDFDTRRMISMWFGLAMILAAWAYDIMCGRKPDLMFWIHIFGGLAFWGGLTLHDGGTELQKFIYCLINIGLVGFSIFIDRRFYAVLGGLGVATYLGYLASDVFKDVMLFSFALSGIGLLVIFAGLFWHRNREKWSASMTTKLPEIFRRLRPVDIYADLPPT